MFVKLVGDELNVDVFWVELLLIKTRKKIFLKNKEFVQTSPTKWPIFTALRLDSYFESGTVVNQ